MGSPHIKKTCPSYVRLLPKRIPGEEQFKQFFPSLFTIHNNNNGAAFDIKEMALADKTSAGTIQVLCEYDSSVVHEFPITNLNFIRKKYAIALKMTIKIYHGERAKRRASLVITECEATNPPRRSGQVPANFHGYRAPKEGDPGNVFGGGGTALEPPD